MCPAGPVSFLRHLLVPVFFGCHQVPQSELVCITPCVPHHCHENMGMTSRPRAPSEH